MQMMNSQIHLNPNPKFEEKNPHTKKLISETKTPNSREYDELFAI
jgi:hypothetical protein